MSRALSIALVVVLLLVGIGIIQLKQRGVGLGEGIPPGEENAPPSEPRVSGRLLEPQVSVEVRAGEEMSIAVRFMNTGEKGASFEVEAGLGGELKRKSTHLSAGETGELAFEFTPERSGEISVNLKSGGRTLDTQTISIHVTEVSYPELRLDATVGGEWGRGEDDLPIYKAEIVCDTKNVGGAPATQLALVLKLDGVEVHRDLSEVLAVGESHKTRAELTLTEGLYELSIEAESAEVARSISKGELEVSFPRWFSREICKFYITSQNSTVRSTLDQILSEKSLLRDDLDAVRDWLDDQITYRYDNEVHGEPEYWQLSTETLDLRTGDCEDFSILRCSLYRAYGVPTDGVYVALGVDSEGNWHAYVLWYDERVRKWRVIEPQVGGIVLSDFAAWETSTEYDTQHCFNDAGYMPYDEGKFT